MSLLHDLLTYYNSSPVGSIANEVSGRILDNLLSIQDLSLEELAERCNASPSTLSRQIKSLSGLSYNQFRKEMQDCISRHILVNFPFTFGKDHPFTPAGYVSALTFYVEKLLESCTDEILDQITEMIRSHQCIRVYKDYAGSVAKRQFQADLVVTGKKTVFLSSIEEWRKDVVRTDPDTLLIVSNSCEPSSFRFSEYTSLIKTAKANGAAIVAFDSLYRPSLAKYADICISFESNQSAMDQILVDTIIDFILIDYRKKYLS